MSATLPWIVLLVFITILLILDFIVLHRPRNLHGFRKAALEVILFISSALLFSLFVHFVYKQGMVNNPNDLKPGEAVIKYFTGYFIELSLSVDNLFVISVIFSNYRIQTRHQHKLLFLGVLGAIIFRAGLISVGLILIQRIQVMTIILGVFLLFTAFKMLKKESEHEELHQPNKLMKWLSFNKSQDGGKFFIRTGGKRSFTVLFAALLTIEFTDLLFALDSIPAIFAVTTDPFLVYSSNIFAILGLRSLYFFLKNMLDRFVYLKYSIFAILLFVSVKLMVSGYVEFPEWFSLLLISVSLVIGILVSLKIGSDKTTSLSKSMNMKKSTKSPNPEIKADKMQ